MYFAWRPEGDGQRSACHAVAVLQVTLPGDVLHLTGPGNQKKSERVAAGSFTSCKEVSERPRRPVSVLFRHLLGMF